MENTGKSTLNFLYQYTDLSPKKFPNSRTEFGYILSSK